ncbi:lipoprotein-releasing ABC transporter permease subunit [Massilia rubra]|uniref:Lipoprotein-releasing ABC transporter permease subunit n=1 Tax=Massilia rubra TaxID=2607910 RepID=A0ABX0LL67_9BURK|nr:lipoprotein-releasing ABC transporter permease subunit [Massilia rubra]NHZ35606.1 lipoprotein-releasing ABC transporter permease subunit [Massilia rubra]
MLANLPYELQIALRYTSAQRRSERNPMLSVISLISVSGIALGVAALIVVLSVMNGFQKEVAARMLSMIPHIEVIDERGGLRNWEQTLAQARGNPAVSGGAPFVTLQGMLLYDETMRPVAVQGILPAAEKTVSSIADRIKDGKLDDLQPGRFNIVLGYELASKLGVKVGDKLSLLVAPQGGAATAWTPRRQVFTVTGTFNVGHNDYDSSVALAHIDDARAVEQLPLPSGLRLSLHDLHQAPKVAQQLSSSMPPELMFRDWTRQNEVWFAALQSQKRMMFLILVLIIAVAAFNLVSTLVMKVNDKQADIAILRTLGASPRSIMAVFMMQGALVGVIGTAAGVAAGVLVAMNIDMIMPVVEKLLGSKLLSKEIYFLSSVPSDPQWQDIVMIGGVSVALAFVATLYPSYGAARINPAESLRYE